MAQEAEHLPCMQEVLAWESDDDHIRVRDFIRVYAPYIGFRNVTEVLPVDCTCSFIQGVGLNIFPFKSFQAGSKNPGASEHVYKGEHHPRKPQAFFRTER